MNIVADLRFAGAAVVAAFASLSANGAINGNTEWWSVSPRTTIGEVVAAVPDSAVATAATNYTDSVGASARSYADGVARELDASLKAYADAAVEEAALAAATNAVDPEVLIEIATGAKANAAQAALAATNYTISATNALAADLGQTIGDNYALLNGRIDSNAVAATNYTDSATNGLAVVVQPRLPYQTNAIPTSAIAGLADAISEYAPPPGNYAAVSNAAMSAMSRSDAEDGMASVAREATNWTDSAVASATNLVDEWTFTPPGDYSVYFRVEEGLWVLKNKTSGAELEEIPGIWQDRELYFENTGVDAILAYGVCPWGALTYFNLDNASLAYRNTKVGIVGFDEAIVGPSNMAVCVKAYTNGLGVLNWRSLGSLFDTNVFGVSQSGRICLKNGASSLSRAPWTYDPVERNFVTPYVQINRTVMPVGQNAIKDYATTNTFSSIVDGRYFVAVDNVSRTPELMVGRATITNGVQVGASWDGYVPESTVSKTYLYVATILDGIQVDGIFSMPSVFLWE